MQFRILTAVVVFLGSYLPLSVILLAQDFDYDDLNGSLCWTFWKVSCRVPLKHPMFAIAILIVCAICFFATLIVLSVVKPRQEIVLLEARYIPTDLMNYTLPYVVSFMSIDYHDTSKFVGLLVFLAWMFWITYKSGQILLNPILIVFGWRLYELKYRYASDQSKQEFISRALSKGPIDVGEVHRQISIADIQMIKPEPVVV